MAGEKVRIQEKERRNPGQSVQGYPESVVRMRKRNQHREQSTGQRSRWRNVRGGLAIRVLEHLAVLDF